MADWGFYGRKDELLHLERALGRGRWFFVKITGRRRIGKTRLIEEARAAIGNARPVFYVPIPDSGDAGVIAAVHDALDTFRVSEDERKVLTRADIIPQPLDELIAGLN